MKSKSRCHIVTVTAHEKLLLVFYRSLPLERQRDIDGLLGRWWQLPRMDARWRAEGQTLRIGTLNASHIEPFIEASHDVVGVERRAA